MLDNAIQPSMPDSVPVPDIVTSTVPHEDAHEVLKEVAENTSPEAPGNQITLHDQLKQAEEQFSVVG